MIALCILLEKSVNNKKCADWAYEKALYDIAVSRLYYSLYQKILIQSEGNLNTGVNSHKETINTYFEQINKESNSRAIQSLMQKMRIERNKADYQRTKLKDSEYKHIEGIYKKIDEYIDKELR